MKRQCTRMKADGSPCGAPPLKDQDYCAAHGGLIGGPVEGSGRKPTVRYLDLAKQKLEEHAEQIAQVYIDAMGAMKPSMTTKDGTFFEGGPDHLVRLKAIDDWQNRILGRPRQTTEISGPDGGAITIAELARLASEEDPDADSPPAHP